MPDVRVFFVQLPTGILGFCDHAKRTIWMTTGMSQRQRREVLQHEMTHLDRGPVSGHWESREEKAIEESVARALITIDAFCDALRWTRDVSELADELNVPTDLVVVRWQTLRHPAERAAVKAVLADVAELIAP